MNTEDHLDLDGELPFPWSDVEAARANRKLQKLHPSTQIQDYLGQAKPCPKCHTEPAQLTWFYFESPAWTWGIYLCGRAGWLSICDPCRLQIDFFCEVMS